MAVNKEKAKIQYLTAGGQMGDLIRSKDWSSHPLGPIENWPANLRISVNIILNSRYPMFLWWGPELFCFYNDAYRPSLGSNGKHPFILGMPGKDAWSEIWDIISPMIDEIRSTGQPTWNEDQLIPIYRNGKVEDVYWTFSYSAVHDDYGSIAGILVTCSETTEKIKSYQSLERINQQYLSNIMQAPVAMGILSGPNSIIEIANPLLLEIWGKTSEEVLGKPVFEALTDAQGQGYEAILSNILATGEYFKAEEMPLSLIRNGTPETIYVSFALEAIRDPNEQISGVMIVATNVTEQVVARKSIEESEARFRLVANNAPVMIWVAGKDKKCTFLSREWLEYTGRPLEEELGDGWLDHIHPDDQERIGKIYFNAYEEQKEFYMEFRAKKHTGEYRWLSDKGVPRFNTDGEFIGFIGACADIHGQITHQKELQENEERLNLIIAASELGTWEFNLATEEVWYSARHLEILGFPTDSKPDHNQLRALIHPEDVQVRNEAFEIAWKTGKINYEARIFQPNGNMRWVEGKGKVIFDENQKPVKMMGTLRDITEIKEYQQKLLERELKFRLLATAMPQFVWTCEANGQFNYFNSTFLEFSGLNSGQIFRNGWLQLVHPDELEESKTKWEHCLKTGKNFDIEHRLRAHDGEYRWQFTRVIPQEDMNGKLQMWVGTSNDIHSQKMFSNILEKQVQERTRELEETNEALARSEERYHMMIDEVQDYAIIYLNSDGKIENWNQGAQKIKGYKAEEIVGKNFSVFFTPEDLKNQLPERLLNLALTNGKSSHEGWRVKKDGTRFWASATITAIHNDQGKVIGFSKVTHDLTEKKSASDQLKNNAEELSYKNKELEKMNLELNSFAYISSHDLQEPLRKIQTFANRIIEKEPQNLSETGKDYLDRMQKAASRMQKLIEDLLTYSKTSNVEQKFIYTDLNEIVHEIQNDHKETFVEKNALLEVGNLCKLNIIPYQFRQLMDNLISNSLKFTKEGVRPLIKISSEKVIGGENANPSLKPGKTYCKITLTDNGIGFEPKYKEKIFEVFQRLHGKTEYPGTGIGLAIVKKIVDNHHGVITADGTLNQGAKFDIYFPLES